MTKCVREPSHEYHRHCWISPARSGRPAARCDESPCKPQKWLLPKLEEKSMQTLTNYLVQSWSPTNLLMSRSVKVHIHRLRSTPNSPLLSQEARTLVRMTTTYIARLDPRALLCDTMPQCAHTQTALNNKSFALSPSTAHYTGCENIPLSRL